MITKIVLRLKFLLLLSIVSFAVFAKPIANFTSNNVDGCAPLVVHFTDLSTNNPTRWKWDLGNGTVSFLQNPSVTYFNPGQYTITLIASNSTGSDTIIKAKYITVFAAPTVQFTSNTTTGCYPLAVQFTDQSKPGLGNITLWQWDFGDGSSSNLQNPAHVYTGAGYYNVTLRVRNNNSCISTISKTKYININNGVKAAFSNSMPNNCSLPVNISFSSLSTGTGTLTYRWSFGDGTVSSQTNPQHIYTALGSYDVQLIVTNSNGCADTVTKINGVVAGKVTAAFIIPDSICVQQSFLTNNTSNPIPASSAWSFGDGTIATTANTVKTYTTAGSYTIKLVSNFGSCKDSAIKIIIVKPKPTAAFTSDGAVACGAPFTVNFTNQSKNSMAWFWDFGDGTTSTWQTPSHIYSSFGNYTVKLIATNANGCTDSLQITNFIKIQKPVTSLLNLPDSGCVPFTKTFKSNTVSLNAVTSYLWNFGDGTTAATPTPTHTYTTAGSFNVTLIVITAGGCTDTITIANAITASIKPTANFTASPKVTCAHMPVNFSDLSTGTVTNWLWVFGDGSTSSLQNPNHVYSDTGFFSVQLIVGNNNCSDSISFQKYVHILPPIAAYNYTLDCKKPYQRNFLDLSIGGDIINWDFGDGTTSTLRNPVHIYTQPGIYIVRQTVINNKTGCDFSIIKNIDIVDVKAAFTASDSVVCKGTNIKFTSSSRATDVSSFNWNFGDGKIVDTISNTINHVYKTTGNYNVRLIITNVLGCKDTIMQVTKFRVNGPTAQFKSAVPGSCLNNAIVFNDFSTGDGINPIKTYTWSYGDGAIDSVTAGPFQHTYSSAGIYAVNLVVRDSLGCTDSFQLPVPLIISKPVAIFSTRDTLSCPAQNILFINQSTGPKLSYFWKFGDGITSILQTPVHSYSADGLYTVSLNILDEYGCSDSSIKLNYISIKTPVPNFSMSDSLSICPPLIVQFTNQSTNAVISNWDFGDGTSTLVNNPSHFYDYPGIYMVQLTVTGPGGCRNILKKPILIKGPTGSFIYNPLIGCAPLMESFKATTSEIAYMIWDFNDGTTVNTTDSSVTHSYTHPGIYLPKIILADSMGCRVPIVGLDTIVVNGATANINFINKAICDSGNVAFTDSSFSNDVIIGWNWTLADGIFSTDKNPIHHYAANGVYFPKLVITTQHGCTDSTTSTIAVKVVSSPQIAIFSSQNGCVPLNMVFNGIVSVADTSSLSWNWSFPDNSTSALQNPSPINYTNAGVYNISVIATNTSGCMDTAGKTIEAYGIPVVRTNHEAFICQNKGITLQATGAGTYNWSPAKGLSCATCASPIATPDSITKYTVTGSTIYGCTATDTVNVDVKYPFTIRVNPGDTLCKGQSRNLSVTGGATYVWTPATGLNNNKSATPTASPDSTTNYTVIAKDEKSCFSDTGYVFLKVYPIPQVSAGKDKTINIGQTYDLTPTLSADITEVLWSPTSAIFRSSYPGITIKPNTNTEYTVSVKNGGGCMAQDKVSIFVICDGTNVFIPNTFSPNGDGNNDVFFPRGSGLFKIKEFKIYDRWGAIVFARASFNANDASAGWDGTLKGAKLNPDVYVYTIEIICNNNSILMYKGNVALIQ